MMRGIETKAKKHLEKAQTNKNEKTGRRQTNKVAVEAK